MAAGVAVLASGGAAWAGDPSVDQIISALRPSAGSLVGNTRGIRAMAPAAPAEPEPSRPGHVRRQRVMAAAPDGDAASLDLTVEFRSGSAELTPGAARTLSKLGGALASPALAAYRFRIEGHTDTTGVAETNLALSQARAERVASFLEQGFGVAATRLETVGMGEQGLLVATPDQTDEPRNRRVHVVNLGSS